MTIKKTFAYHKPSEDGLEKIASLRALFSFVHDRIMEQAPESRERAIALTNLETTAMWAIKAVVCNDPKSEVDLGVKTPNDDAGASSEAPTPTA